MVPAPRQAQKPDWVPINAKWKELKAKAAADTPEPPLNAMIVRCFHCDTGLSGVNTLGASFLGYFGDIILPRFSPPSFATARCHRAAPCDRQCAARWFVLIGALPAVVRRIWGFRGGPADDLRMVLVGRFEDNFGAFAQSARGLNGGSGFHRKKPFQA